MAPKRKLSEMTKEPYQAVNWAFTFNNYTDAEVAFMKSLSDVVDVPYKFLQFQKETCPTTSTPHLQGMICLKKKTVRGTLQKMLSPARPLQLSCKPCYADLINNVDYTSKPGGTDLYTDGVLALCEDERKLDADGRADVLLKLAEAGDFATLRNDHAASFLYNHAVLHRAYASSRTFDVIDGVLDNYWVFGPGGSGKDQYVLDKASTPFIKSGSSKWWDGYNYQDDVVIRDVGKGVLAYIDDLKNWLDRYPVNVEWKGGGGVIRPKRVFITSNFHPAKLLGEGSPHLQPLLRRLQVIHVENEIATPYKRVCTTRPKLATLVAPVNDPYLTMFTSERAREISFGDGLDDEVVDDGM